MFAQLLMLILGVGQGLDLLCLWASQQHGQTGVLGRLNSRQRSFGLGFFWRAKAWELRREKGLAKGCLRAKFWVPIGDLRGPICGVLAACNHDHKAFGRAVCFG